MSGGHFDYAFCVVADFNSQLKKEIENNKKEDEYGYSHNYSNETIKKLKYITNYLDLAEQYMYAAEWLYSGDFGEDDFLEHCKEQEKIDKLFAD